MKRLKTVTTIRFMIVWIILVKLDWAGSQVTLVVLKGLEHFKSKQIVDSHLFDFKLLFESFVAPNKL